MTPTSPANEPEALRAVLRENLDELLEAIDAMAAEALDQRIAPEEWTVREILLHVIHTERWLQPQLLELRAAVAAELAAPPSEPLTLPDPTSAPTIDELRWALSAVREDTEQLIDGVSPAQLREPANVGDGEDAVDVTLRTMVLTVADHQLFHLRQLQRTLEQP